MTPQPKAVLELAATIVETEEKLAALREQWEALFSGAKMAAPELPEKPANAPVKRRRAASPNSLPSKIIGILEIFGGKSSVADLATTAGSDALAVSRALSRMQVNGKVENISRGIWALKTEVNDQRVAEATP